MKTLLYLLCCCLVWPASATTVSEETPVTLQPPAKAYRSFNYWTGVGFKGGAQTATLTTTGHASQNKKGLLGYTAGIVWAVPISQNIALQTELNYTQRGLSYRYQEDYDRLKSAYVDLPVMLNLSFGDAAKVFVNLGGYGGYWLSGKLQNKTDGNKTSTKLPFDSDASDGYSDNRIDYGLIGGLGLSYKMGSGNVFVEGRYTHGLSDISKISPKPDGYHASSHRIMGISLGYIFSFK